MMMSKSRMAEKLFKKVYYDKLVTKANLDDWAAQFKKLRVDDDWPKSIIRETLLWYIDRYGDEHIPYWDTARYFRDNFVAIRSERFDKKIAEKELADKLYWFGQDQR